MKARIDAATEVAVTRFEQDVMGAVIRSWFPEITSGDVDPLFWIETSDKLKRTVRALIEHVVESNAPVDGENTGCCGSGPHTPGEVRVLPYSADGNLIVCRRCYGHELRYRRWRNSKVPTPIFELPTWNSLKVYEEVP